ncbi:MAG: hypothetical protein B6I20_02210 [Bacteroidetes bacterium 4572_117]|nr:MAG: hypothetical protein B6I20_02210 [Bacteroidetes bacterium 4572_117]
MGNKGNIMVVDDMQSNITLLCNLLKDEGYTTCSADSGELALVELENNIPDLIFLDVKMPGLNGFEVCKQIKQKGNLAGIPVVFLTGATDINDKLQGFKYGAVDYVTKPFQKEELLVRLKTHLSIKEKELELKRINIELVIAKEKAEEREKQNSSLTKTATDAIINIDFNGIILSWNNAAEKIFGYPSSEMVNSNLSKIMPAQYREGHNKGVMLLNKGGKEKYLGRTIELEACRKNGQKFPIELSLSSWEINNRKYYTGFIRDITARKHAENELIKAKERAESDKEKIKESEEKYRTLFENMTNSFALHKIVLDKKNKPVDYVFIEVNKMFEIQTGLKKENIINKKVTEVLTGIENDPATWIDIYGKVALTGKQIQFEQFSELLNKWYSVLAFSNKKGFFATIFSDITEQKRIEKKILNTIIDTEEKERSRFSRELHDGLGPMLSTIKMYFQWLATNKDSSKTDLIVEKGESNINEAIETLKEISNNISPRTLNRFGLIAATETFINKLKETSAYKINLKSDLGIRLEPNIEITLYRVITELINNTFKHANANIIDIEILHDKKQAVLITKYFDNGEGFDVNKEINKNQGFGIMNIQQRIKTLGGELTINSGEKGMNVKIIIHL